MDVKDRVLFVGDNIEHPIPYLYSEDIDAYIETLEEYLTRNPDTVISGHDPLMNNTRLISENLEYVRKFKKGKVDVDSLTESGRRIHEQNLKTASRAPS